MVCVKPAGIISQSDDSGKKNALSVLSEMTGSEVFPVHRLDKETGGVMVFALTKSAAANLSTQIAKRYMQKCYIALVHGCPENDEGEYSDLLFRDKARNKSFVVLRERKGVKKAVLKYRKLSTTVIEEKKFTLVEIKLLTGRTHQIRVQFSSRQMPLAGDRKYGGKDMFYGLGLWAYKLSFSHPVTGEMMTFEAKPENFLSEFTEN